MSVMDQEERNRTEKGIRIDRGAPGGKKRKEFGGGGGEEICLWLAGSSH